jgi:hypothetical protein
MGACFQFVGCLGSFNQNCGKPADAISEHSAFEGSIKAGLSDSQFQSKVIVSRAIISLLKLP